MSSSGGQLLVLHQGALGDFFLTLAVVQAVRESLNPTRVVAIASASSARLVAGRSAVDACLHPDSVGLHTLFGGDLNQDLARIIQQSTCILSLLGGRDEPVSRRLRLLAACSTSPERNARGSSLVICVDPRPTPETLTRGLHITQQWADAIRAEGLAIADPTPSVIRSPRHPATCDAPGESPYVIIHPGSGGRGKCWPVEGFIALASQMARARFRWLLGPAEVESGVADAVQKHATAAGQLVMLSPDLERAAVTIARAKAYVGNDAGMTHLAAALGTPTVAVFVSTDPRVWRSLGEQVQVVTPGDAGVAAVAEAVRRLMT